MSIHKVAEPGLATRAPHTRYECVGALSRSCFATQQSVLTAATAAPSYKALPGKGCSEMAYKVAKSEAPRLFAFIRRLQFSFDPFSTESTAVREAWRQLTSPTLTAANPKCKIDVVSARGVAPAMEAEFVDGDKRPIVASGAAANLVGELYRTAHSISLDYALKGKPPPT